MTAPNILNISNIRGNTAVLNVITVAANVVANPSNSNKVFKINTLLISNINGTVSADVTAEFVRSGAPYDIVSTVSVPADATLVALSKDTPIYVEEGDFIRITASSNSSIQAICSYEGIS